MRTTIYSRIIIDTCEIYGTTLLSQRPNKRMEPSGLQLASGLSLRLIRCPVSRSGTIASAIELVEISRLVNQVLTMGKEGVLV